MPVEDRPFRTFLDGLPAAFADAARLLCMSNIKIEFRAVRTLLSLVGRDGMGRRDERTRQVLFGGDVGQRIIVRVNLREVHNGRRRVGGEAQGEQLGR